MWKRATSIAMAFVGLTVGAGFASGQEMMQYFVAFGENGLWGVILASVVMIISGLAVLSLASYFQADEHSEVFDEITQKWISKILDIAVMVTLFCTGFVMFAGAGANLNQQFGLDVWIGATIMVALTLGVGMLDADKVSRVIGMITPFIIVFLLGAGIYTLVTNDTSMAEAAQYTTELLTTLPHWSISALNYVGFCVMVAVSMSIVIGGSYLNPREAGMGGLMGGTIYGGLLTLVTFALFFKVETVGHEDMPTLAIVNEIHPVLGTIMAIIIYGMIFNTAIGMFYALGRRLTRNTPHRFRLVFIVTVLVGFGLSFFGFKSLVGSIYPALGYFGIALIVVLCGAYLLGRNKLVEESKRRGRIRKLARRKMHPERKFTTADQKKLDRAVADSNVSNVELQESVRDDIVEELVSDDNVDFTEEDAERIVEKDNERLEKLAEIEEEHEDDNPRVTAKDSFPGEATATASDKLANQTKSAIKKVAGPMKPKPKQPKQKPSADK